jgi:hypothetical protein
VNDEQQELFDKRLQWLETLFRPLSSKIVKWVNTHDHHSFIINAEDYPLVQDEKIWRERDPVLGKFFLRMHNRNPHNDHGPRPMVHRVLMNVTNPKIHVEFENENPFDLRKENLKIT